MYFRSVLTALLCLPMIVSTGRADPQADPPLPPPRVAPAEPVPAPLPHVVYAPQYRVSAYAVWEMNAVDRRGFFRPRVIATPYGAYYHYNGAPYPWTATNSLNYMPYARD